MELSCREEGEIFAFSSSERKSMLLTVVPNRLEIRIFWPKLSENTTVARWKGNLPDDGERPAAFFPRHPPPLPLRDAPLAFPWFLVSLCSPTLAS